MKTTDEELTRIVNESLEKLKVRLDKLTVPELTYKSDLDKLAKYFIQLSQGDDYILDEAYEFLKELGYVDELGFEL